MSFVFVAQIPAKTICVEVSERNSCALHTTLDWIEVWCEHFISTSGIACWRAYVLSMLISFIFFLTVHLEINYLRIYLTDLYQIVRICMGMITPTFSPSFKEHCYSNRFLARIGENWHTPFILSAGIPRRTGGSQSRCTLLLTPPMSLRRLIKIRWTVTRVLEARLRRAGLRAGLCHAFLQLYLLRQRWALADRQPTQFDHLCTT